MQGAEEYVNERLDHLGMVAGVCQEIGLASWRDAQDPGNRKPRECGNGDRGDGAQWMRVEPPAVVFGAAVLRRASPSSMCWALRFIMVLCEARSIAKPRFGSAPVWLRPEPSIPDQVQKPTTRPTMRSRLSML
jgi:hypothetical protein